MSSTIAGMTLAKTGDLRNNMQEWSCKSELFVMSGPEGSRLGNAVDARQKAQMSR